MSSIWLIIISSACRGSIIINILIIVKVDAYREAGKEEAASRLEEQLSLIHTRFQVIFFVIIIIIIFCN